MELNLKKLFLIGYLGFLLAPMAPGRRRGAKGAKSKDELNLGDLVLAKVKGHPAWPAKVCSVCSLAVVFVLVCSYSN